MFYQMKPNHMTDSELRKYIADHLNGNIVEGMNAVTYAYAKKEMRIRGLE